jgi:hypothetical protein
VNAPSSHAEGQSSNASGNYSHAEGNSTVTVGSYSHAEGNATITAGTGAHAEGFTTSASGNYSHAEGHTTIASGPYAHASGYKATVSHSTAFAWQGSTGTFGESTYTSHGPGTYNINPVGGLGGFWIANTNLSSIINAKASHLDVTNTVLSLQSSGLTIYFAGNTASDVPPFRLATTVYANSTGTVYTTTTTGAAVTNNAYIAQWLTPSGMSLPPVLPGVVEVTAVVNVVDGVPNSTLWARAELYRYTDAGVYVDEIEEGTPVLLTEGGVDVTTTFTVPIANRVEMTGYRLGIRLKLVTPTTVAGTDTIGVKSEDQTLSRVQIPVNAASYALASDLVTSEFYDKELLVNSSGLTTTIPISPTYRAYKVVVTNSTDIVFGGISSLNLVGQFPTLDVRIIITNPAFAVTLPASGVGGVYYPEVIDLTTTIANTTHYLSVRPYATNDVMVTRWLYREP